MAGTAQLYWQAERENTHAAPVASIAPECFWYAADTCPRHEKAVARQLQEREIECFLPLYHSERRWKDRRKELDLVLFPGYVFVHLMLRDRLRVLQLPSVVKFVSFNGSPATMPENEIHVLRNGIANEVYAHSNPYLKVARRVRVDHQPLSWWQSIPLR